MTGGPITGLRIPPSVPCRECGRKLRTWRAAPICGACLEAAVAERPAESLREFRRRLPSIAELADKLGEGERSSEKVVATPRPHLLRGGDSRDE